MNNQMGGMPKMDLSGAQDVVCEKCNANTFDTVFIVKRMPGGVIPIPIFRCASCRHINKEIMPSEQDLKSARMAGFTS